MSCPPVKMAATVTLTDADRVYVGHVRAALTAETGRRLTGESADALDSRRPVTVGAVAALLEAASERPRAHFSPAGARALIDSSSLWEM